MPLSVDRLDESSYFGTGEGRQINNIGSWRRRQLLFKGSVLHQQEQAHGQRLNLFPLARILAFPLSTKKPLA